MDKMCCYIVFQIWGYESWPEVCNTSSLWLPQRSTDRRKGDCYDCRPCEAFFQVEDLLKHLEFDNMKKNLAVNPFASDVKPKGMRDHFVREGKVTPPKKQKIKK